MKAKAVIIFSGGQDSTTCLFWAIHQQWEVYPITFDYGQKHSREIGAAMRVLAVAKEFYPISVRAHEIVDLGPILKGSSPLVNTTEKLEEYADHLSLPGKLEKTFVPMRNQLFITIAANRAAVLGAKYLVTGVCQEDSGGYPDCTYDFIQAVEGACNTGTFTGKDGAPAALSIRTPLMDRTKAGAVRLAMELPGCYEALSYSHTSYGGEYPPTSKDHASLLRAKGFIEANIPDPLVLRAYRQGLMKLPETPNYEQELVDRHLILLGAS